MSVIADRIHARAEARAIFRNVALEIKKPGDNVEGYRVMAELGRGAASVIYLVNDPKTKHVWALKHVIKEGPKDQRFLDQAEQEYLVASKLNVPSVRKIEKVIRKKESLLGGVKELYLVMEHVDGVSCERHPPGTFEAAVFIFEQVAQGLASMHRAGFVHADMKPNNVIVDEKNNAKIIDLGQSCKIGTVKQRIQGTPDYIAPEQVHLRAITPKTDVYNLGASLYWILTRSFVPTALSKGESLLGSVDDSLLARPKPPVLMNPRVPEMLNDVIMQCVEVDPDDRPTMDVVTDKLNLIRSRLLAEQSLRKSGQHPSVEGGGGSRAGMNGMKGDSNVFGPGGSKGLNLGGSGAGGGSGAAGGSSGVPSGRRPLKKEPPPIDPGPGIEGADEDDEPKTK